MKFLHTHMVDEKEKSSRRFQYVELCSELFSSRIYFANGVTCGLQFHFSVLRRTKDEAHLQGERKEGRKKEEGWLYNIIYGSWKFAVP